MIDRALGIFGMAATLIGLVAPSLWPNMHKRLCTSILKIGIGLVILAVIVACLPEIATTGNNNVIVNNPLGSIIAPSGGVNTIINPVTRDPDGLYQADNKIGTVAPNPTIDEAKKELRFHGVKLESPCDPQKPFEYGNWILECKNVPLLASRMVNVVLASVTCAIISHK
jgi:hypothetical protein